MRSLMSGPILSTMAGASARQAVGLAGLLMVLAGCQNDGVQHYQVPKPPVYRLLGAIVPHEATFWFFKLTGPDEAVLEHKPEFDRLLESVTFAGADKPPTWKLPQGWREEPGDQMRFATLVLGPPERPLELTVSRFGRNADDKSAALLANVNRWRGQMGVSKIEADRLGEIARPRDVHGVTFYVMEVTGPKPGKTARGMGMGGEPKAAPRPAPAEQEPQKQPKLRYTTPPGWQEAERRGGLAEAAFQAGDGAEVTVMHFPHTPGMADVGENVKRWRGQVGLPEIGLEQARRAATDIRVDGAPGSYVDLSGPTGKRLLAVMASRGDQVWFFKILGPERAVGRQKSAFETFVQSVRFE
jgi:hypothetical protein